MCDFQVTSEPVKTDVSSYIRVSYQKVTRSALGQHLPASPSSSPRFSTMMQICFLSWRGLENFRQHLLHSRLLGARLSPPSGARGLSPLGITLFSASSSSGLAFFVDPFGLPLFLFMTENSAKEARRHHVVTGGDRAGHALNFQVWKYVWFHVFVKKESLKQFQK